MFSPVDVDRLQQFAGIVNPQPPEDASPAYVRENAGDAEIAITSWGGPCFDDSILDSAPHLKIITHAGGSVKPQVCPDFWRRGMRITSAAPALSMGVAEYCLGLILTAPKRAYFLAERTRTGEWTEGKTSFGGWHEIYQQKIGIIGAGFAGRHLVELLRPFTCEVLVFDPYLSTEAASALRVRKVATLEELFESCLVISLNAPTTPETIGMIRGHHFARLQAGAVFINTARSALINTPEMVEELRKGTFVACLDVLDEEPPAVDDPIRNLPNVWLTPHIAGAVAENQMRIGSMVVDEIERYAKSEPFRFEVTEERLKTLA